MAVDRAGLRVGDADGDMVYTGWPHRSIVPRIVRAGMTFKDRYLHLLRLKLLSS